MPKRSRRRGVVLLLVMVVVVLLALSASTFALLMGVERRATLLAGRQAKARASVDAGVIAMKMFLLNDRQTRLDEGGLYDNPDRFRGQLVVDDDMPVDRGRFSIVAPALDEEGLAAGVRFGLENESTRLNLNSLLMVEDQQLDGGRDLLLALPGMTEETADAILDWIDEDDEPRTYGAEIDHYSGLSPAYAPRNGPLETVEELLLVRGVTPELLFGLDVNRNGMVDPHEQGELAGAEVDTADGSLDRGWSGYLTLLSMERNATDLGEPRIFLNTDDMAVLHADLSAALPAEWANFIVAYRQFGPYQGSGGEEQSASAVELDLNRAAQHEIGQVLDLIGQKVRIPGSGDDEPTVLQSPFPDGPIAMGVYLPRLMDTATVNPSPVIPGRINVNQAPRAILLGIPGMTEEIVEAIISQRNIEDDATNVDRQHETWLLTEALVTLDEMKALMPYVTAGGDVFRAQAVGYFDGGGVSARVEIIFDATTPLPRLLSWKDVTHLGRGYALETLGTELIEVE